MTDAQILARCGGRELVSIDLRDGSQRRIPYSRHLVGAAVAPTGEVALVSADAISRIEVLRDLRVVQDHVASGLVHGIGLRDGAIEFVDDRGVARITIAKHSLRRRPVHAPPVPKQQRWIAGAALMDGYWQILWLSRAVGSQKVAVWVGTETTIERIAEFDSSETVVVGLLKIYLWTLRGNSTGMFPRAHQLLVSSYGSQSRASPAGTVLRTPFPELQVAPYDECDHQLIVDDSKAESVPRCSEATHLSLATGTYLVTNRGRDVLIENRRGRSATIPGTHWPLLSTRGDLLLVRIDFGQVVILDADLVERARLRPR